MKPTLGLVFGLASEARLVLGRRRWRMVDGRPIYRWRFHDDTSLIAIQSGVGGERALSAAHWLISEGATALTAIGLSGGLYPGLRAGDLLIAAAVLQVDGVKSTSVWDTDADFSVRALSTLSAKGIPVLPDSNSYNPTVLLPNQAVSMLRSYHKTGCHLVFRAFKGCFTISITADASKPQ